MNGAVTYWLKTNWSKRDWKSLPAERVFVTSVTCLASQQFLARISAQGYEPEDGAAASRRPQPTRGSAPGHCLTKSAVRT